MKRWRRWLSCYLVLGLVFASAVGISPTLHLWVEHGGEGHAHSHAGLPKEGSLARKHTHAHLPPGGFLRAAAADNDLERLLVEKYPQPKLFGLEVKDVYRAIGNLITRVFEQFPQAPTDKDEEGHTHHSLAQILLSGAVEGISDVPPLVNAPTAFTVSSSVTSILFLAFHFDPQTASRAPPIRS